VGVGEEVEDRSIVPSVEELFGLPVEEFGDDERDARLVVREVLAHRVERLIRDIKQGDMCPTVGQQFR